MEAVAVTKTDIPHLHGAYILEEEREAMSKH
jgi:hypothetical protein